MDDFMLDYELIRSMQEEMPKAEEPKEKKVSTSPYINATQEAMGQLANMFSDLDNIFQEMFEERDRQLMEELAAEAEGEK